MARGNQLIFCGFVSAIVVGCAGVPPSTAPAPVLEAQKTAPLAAPAPGVRVPRPSAPAPSDQSADLLFQAIAAAGVDYRNGGRNHQTGFDCSGLVAFVFREAYGLDLPHNSKAQSAYGDAIDAQDLQPGDLVFFNTQRAPYSHVGIYLGEGKFIHAPRSGGAVRTENLSARYWTTRFDGARRIVPAVLTVDYSVPPKRPVVTFP